jgi:hypothetical protein
MGYLQTNLGIFLEGLGKYNVGQFCGRLVYFLESIWYILCQYGIFYVNLVYFMSIWYILWPFRIFLVSIWYIIWPFGIFLVSM